MSKDSSIARKIDKEFEIIFKAPSGMFCNSDQVSVRLSSEYNRKKLQDHLESNIYKIWSDHLNANPSLWNGTKFRMDSLEEKMNDTAVTFNLGITCYRDFIGTNCSPNVHQLCTLGKQNYNNSQAYMSDALGVGSLVKTGDDCFILLRRSEMCGEAAGLLDRPGGHPEPKEVVGEVETHEIEISVMSPGDVTKEIFSSILREIIDEVNIPRKYLSQPQLMGLIRNTTNGGKPSCEYYTSCSLKSEEIRQLYLEGSHSEANESTNIHFISMSMITLLADKNGIWNELTPSTKGCLMLYKICQSFSK